MPTSKVPSLFFTHKKQRDAANAFRLCKRNENKTENGDIFRKEGWLMGERGKYKKIIFFPVLHTFIIASFFNKSN